MAKKVRIEFVTSPYERSHCTQPRGRGSWAFSLERDPCDVIKDVVFTPSCTYAEAKAWARNWAREQLSTGKLRDYCGTILYLYVQP